MRISLPYSRKKRYLTGMDWIVAALDCISRRFTGGSNASQIVLELRGPFDDEKFKSALGDFVKMFPVLRGYPTRCWNLAPFWKIPRRGSQVPVKVEITSVTESGVHPALEESANTPFSEAREHLVFRIFHVGADRHFLAMRFDHFLFDAQGAEALLDIFHCWQQGEDCRARIDGISLTEPAHLSDWMKKFDYGRLLVRMLLELTKKPLAVLPRPTPLKGRKFQFSIIRFSEEEKRAIAVHAERDAGFMMLMPYLLGSAVTALNDVFKARGCSGEDEYVVSVSVDHRRPDVAQSKLFFNNISFLFFRIPVFLAGDRKQVLETLRTQMYDQIKSDFPTAISESSMVMRILPLKVLGWILLRPFKGEFASLGFSCVGKGGYRPEKFMEATVENLYHMPLVPLPPGLGFVVNQYGNKMNATLSFVDGLMSREEIMAVETRVRQLL